MALAQSKLTFNPKMSFTNAAVVASLWIFKIVLIPLFLDHTEILRSRVLGFQICNNGVSQCNATFVAEQ